ncbi:hypothetical protein [Phytohabitans houttuyneae]|nr:hypothetical protein [Phytohabitans houttuyneae]
MFNLREWKSRRAERRAAKVARLADPTARRVARDAERTADRARNINAPGPWTNGGTGA